MVTGTMVDEEMIRWEETWTGFYTTWRRAFNAKPSVKTWTSAERKFIWCTNKQAFDAFGVNVALGKRCSHPPEPSHFPFHWEVRGQVSRKLKRTGTEVNSVSISVWKMLSRLSHLVSLQPVWFCVTFQQNKKHSASFSTECSSEN